MSSAERVFVSSVGRKGPCNDRPVNNFFDKVLMMDKRGRESPHKRYGNIFIHHDGALGDALLSLPCIRALREETGFIHMAGRADVASFLKETGLVEEALSSDSRIFSSLYTDEVEPRTIEFLSGFDRAMIFTVKCDSLMVRNMRKLAPAAQIVHSIPPDGSGFHVADYRLGQLQGAERGAEFFTPLRMPSAYMERARELLKERGSADPGPVIALHPGSGGKHKCWPLERYIELMERAGQDSRLSFVVLTGPAEEGETVEKLAEFARNRKRVLSVRDADLMTAAALLCLCSAYVGNDSGVSHLAGAVGCPSVVLFGPTKPALWRPLGGRVRVIARDSLAEISVGEVHRAISHCLETWTAKGIFSSALLCRDPAPSRA